MARASKNDLGPQLTPAAEAYCRAAAETIVDPNSGNLRGDPRAYARALAAKRVAEKVDAIAPLLQEIAQLATETASAAGEALVAAHDAESLGGLPPDYRKAIVAFASESSSLAGRDMARTQVLDELAEKCHDIARTEYCSLEMASTAAAHTSPEDAGHWLGEPGATAGTTSATKAKPKPRAKPKPTATATAAKRAARAEYQRNLRAAQKEAKAVAGRKKGGRAKPTPAPAKADSSVPSAIVDTDAAAAAPKRRGRPRKH